MSSSSHPVEDVWNQPDKSKTPTFVGYIAENDLLAGRPLDRNPCPLEYDDLKPRNQDRVRILKRLSSAPSGLHIKTIVSETIKGQPIGQAERFDGSDADYQFAYEYLNELTTAVPPDFDIPLLRKRNTKGGLIFAPRTSLLDLISVGKSKTSAQTGNLMDREFALDILGHSQKLNSNQKQHLEKSLESYINRIDDYRLLFDVVAYDDESRGRSRRTFTKHYKTRFNDHGRVARNYAQFNNALETALEESENAVLATFTTDPGTFDDPSRPNPRSILETTESINENFNALNAWLSSDPDTISDTRKENVPAWKPSLDSSNYCYLPDGVPKGGPPSGPVSGRPGENLDYIKALEFTEKGYPHLHVLFFDVPTRESDGMPWLCDKAELEERWKGHGQGQIIDTYPLVYRDDLDEADAEFAHDADEGFVDWYKYGDHDHSDQWVRDRIGDDDSYIDFNSDETTVEATAGAYLGKYISVVLGSLMESTSSIETPKETHQDTVSTWKLALYWATQKQFWTMSERLRWKINPPENLRECPKAARAVREITIDSVARNAKPAILEHYARGSFENLDELDRMAQRSAEACISPNVESTLPTASDFGVIVNYRGAYPVYDLPTEELSSPHLPDRSPEFAQAQNKPLAVDGDRPPPAVDVWTTA